ncbi:MAG TPA: universal stress protein [Gaiellaceae bacterium]|nr:universal stress protein [Gaiellaceae bacterium]
MQAIVCAIDQSDMTDDVVRIAQALATALRGRLVLVHVAPPTEAPGVSAVPAGQERLREDELADARMLLQDVAARFDAGDAEQRTEVGPPADRIVAIAEEENAALLVIGSRGRGDVRSALLGSVSHGVLNKATCPVVIVPADGPSRFFA